MKRYAASYVYLPSGQICKRCVVELEGQQVVRSFPLNEEIESTIWLNGIILLSSLTDYTLKADRSFEDILKDLCNQDTNALYAYYLSGIDLCTFQLLSSARLIKL